MCMSIQFASKKTHYSSLVSYLWPPPTYLTVRKRENNLSGNRNTHTPWPQRLVEVFKHKLNSPMATSVHRVFCIRSGCEMWDPDQQHSSPSIPPSIHSTQFSNIIYPLQQNTDTPSRWFGTSGLFRPPNIVIISSSKASKSALASIPHRSSRHVLALRAPSSFFFFYSCLFFLLFWGLMGGGERGRWRVCLCRVRKLHFII